jgi:hypothetical protein
MKKLLFFSIAALVMFLLTSCSEIDEGKKAELEKYLSVASSIPLSSSEKASSSSEELSSSSEEASSSSQKAAPRKISKKKIKVPEPEPEPEPEPVPEPVPEPEPELVPEPEPIAPPVVYEEDVVEDVKIDNGIPAPPKGICGDKKIICIATAFVLSATSLGIGIWQNSKMQSNIDKANSIAGEADQYPTSSPEYEQGYDENGKLKDDVSSNRNLRNGFYIGSGVFGAAGLVFFFF